MSFCHARRQDNLTAAIHMVVETIFWFHPLVWWIRAHLVEERERACDDDVLSVVSDARRLRRRDSQRLQVLSGVAAGLRRGSNGSNLKRRIEEIMAYRIALRLNFGKKLALAVTGMAALAIPVAIGVINAPVIRAQSRPASTPQFEVASDQAFHPSSPPRGRLSIAVPVVTIPDGLPCEAPI